MESVPIISEYSVVSLAQTPKSRCNDIIEDHQGGESRQYGAEGSFGDGSRGEQSKVYCNNPPGGFINADQVTSWLLIITMVLSFILVQNRQ
jgi:hypothetical protein